MSEKKKISSEDLQNTIDELGELVEKSKDELKRLIEKRPLESAAFILMVGIILGLLWGKSGRD
jgi:CBS-domain-containing membrane protein